MKRAAAQGGVLLSSFAEELGIEQTFAQKIAQNIRAGSSCVIQDGYLVLRGSEPEKRLSPMGKTILKQIRDRGDKGFRLSLIKNREEISVIQDLVRMGLLITDNETVLSQEVYRKIAGNIKEFRSKNEFAAPSEIGKALGIQRKIVFSVIKWMEEDNNEE